MASIVPLGMVGIVVGQITAENRKIISLERKVKPNIY